MQVPPTVRLRHHGSLHEADDLLVLDVAGERRFQRYFLDIGGCPFGVLAVFVRAACCLGLQYILMTSTTV